VQSDKILEKQTALEGHKQLQINCMDHHWVCTNKHGESIEREGVGIKKLLILT
jgi:hypothetical protein